MKSTGKIVLFLFVCLRICCAQECSLHQYITGLGNLVVNALEQDREGFIWAGTESGLYRFDGVRFTEYGRESGLPGRFIVGLGRDTTGRLWVATQDGLAYRSSGDHFKTVTYNNQPLSFGANPAIAMGRSGGIVVGIHSGLFSLSVSNALPEWKSLLPQSRPLSKTAGEIKSVLGLRDGSMLFGCDSGICRLSGTSVTVWGPAQGLPTDNWVRMFERFNGEIWARSLHHIVRLRAGATRFETLDLPSAVNTSYSTVLVEDSAGRILAGLYSGVARFENGQWSVIGENNGFAEGTVEAMLIDRENQPWIGLNGRGIANWLGYDQWEHWTKHQGLVNNQVWALLRDSKGRFWAAQGQRLSIFDPASHAFRTWSPDSSNLDKVRCLAESKDGFIWIGTRSGTLFKVDVSTRKIASQTEVGPTVRIFVDSNDRVWLATSKGLLASQGSGSNRTFKPVVGLNALDSFEDVQQSPTGEIWALTETGLYRSLKVGWERVDISKAGLGRHLSDLAFDHDGQLWVDGAEFGAVRFKISGGAVTSFQRVNLSSKEVLFMLSDSRGWMWIGEDHGLEVFDGVSLHPYSLDNGLIWNDCNAKAVALDKDGSVWVGTSGGISHFTGDRLPVDIPSKPILTNIQYGAENLTQPSARVRWARGSLTFEIASMSFREQKNLMLRYRLIGLEDKWNQTLTPEVRYTELSPRAYRFESAIVNLNSGRMSPIESFNIDITPPWFFTRIFFFSVFLSIVSIAVFIWRWRVRRLVAKQRELESIVLERTQELNHRLSQQQRLQADAERANRAKGDFLAMMSHEIRTPMNGVVGMTTLLESTQLSPQQTDYVKTIRESGASLLSIINDILDFSKIEAGKLNLENTEFLLLDCIDEPLSIIRGSAVQKGIRLVSIVEPNLPSRLQGDPTRIKQILLNLLSNAVKFTSDGAVELHVSQGQNSMQGSTQIVFEVIDSGIGISPETQQRLFQSFTQAETSTTRKYGGTGLGLVICKRLVEMMGGQIGVKSEVGRGSAFRVVLNLQLSTNPSDESPRQIAQNAQDPCPGRVLQKKILVAEDNVINQKVAVRLLLLLGYSADVAENGAEALKLLETGAYHAVLMDMHMPIMDGLATTRAIRNLEGALNRIPIIAVTANAIQGERQKCLAAGMNDFITKPIEKDKFAAALHRWTCDHSGEKLLSA